VCTGRVERPLNAFSGQRLCRLGYVHEFGGPPEIRTPTSGIKSPVLYR
jgi:hypothetical protein